MSQTAKAQEPSMEEILTSIRRIIADDDAGKPARPPDPAPVKPAAAPPPAAAGGHSQDEVDAVLADLDATKPTIAPKPAPLSPALPKPAQPVASDVLDLTEAMAAPPPEPPARPSPAPSFRTIDASSDVVFTDRAPEQPPVEPARAADEARRAAANAMPDRSLLSNATAAAVDNAFNSLAHTVLGNNARTLEDLVKEMLRPMLKSWLDDNLPGLVERIVRAEIERVSRGR